MSVPNAQHCFCLRRIARLPNWLHYKFQLFLTPRESQNSFQVENKSTVTIVLRSIHHCGLVRFMYLSDESNLALILTAKNRIQIDFFEHISILFSLSRFEIGRYVENTLSTPSRRFKIKVAIKFIWKSYECSPKLSAAVTLWTNQGVLDIRCLPILERSLDDDASHVYAVYLLLWDWIRQPKLGNIFRSCDRKRRR